MDRNLFLAITLSILVLVTWSMFQEQGRPTEPGRSLEQAEPTPSVPPTGVVEAPRSVAPSASPDAPTAAAPTPPAPVGPIWTEPKERQFTVQKSLYTVSLTSRGAAIQRWELAKFNEGKRRDRRPLALTTGQAPNDRAGVTPFPELGIGDLANAVWDVEQQNGSTFSFLVERNGITVRKRYAFDEDAYTFRMVLEVANGSGSSIAPEFAIGWPAHAYDAPDFTEQALVALQEASLEQRPLSGLGSAGFLGSITGQRAMLVEPLSGEIDWAGVQTTYFLSALLPDTPSLAIATFIATQPGKAGVTQLSFPGVSIPPGQSLLHEYRGYVGPKEIDRLTALGAEADRSIDLGWSWVAPLTRVFGGLLRAIYQVIPNYGWAIIILTILVRVVTIPLTAKQMRSMERMRALQPKIKELQAKHADDRQVQSQKMMELYRREKVNPLGGCLPMILQLPVFIGLFYALRASIDLRQSPFVGWIDDLSAPETLFTIPGIELPIRVLPLLMGGSMFLQQKITPMQMDPAQAKMMMIVMPIMMTVLFYRFPSGLVLYWMVSNVLAISHQLYIGRRMKKK